MRLRLLVSLLVAAVFGLGFWLGAQHRPAAPPTPNVPPCGRIIDTGATIPADLERTGCAPGVTHYAGYECADGTQLFGNALFWGYAGQVIHLERAATSPAYARAFASCHAPS